MTEDKENVLQPQRKNSGKGARARRRGSVPVGAGGAKEGEGETGLCGMGYMLCCVWSSHILCFPFFDLLF